MVVALIVEPKKSPRPTQICDDTDYLNHCVSPDSYLVYTAGALKIDDHIAAVYCRNGHMFCLPGNRRVGDKVICGTFYIVRVKNGKLVSLSDTDVVKYSLEYWAPESFTDDEIVDSWLP
jgi:hypothetical protein